MMMMRMCFVARGRDIIGRHGDSSREEQPPRTRRTRTRTTRFGDSAALLLAGESDVANARDEDDHHQEEGARAENDQITSFAYFTVGRCESIVRAERALGGDAVCSEKDAEMFGTVRIGLYGNRCPGTVRAFRKVVESGAYERTVFHDVRKGEFVAFGINGANV